MKQKSIKIGEAQNTGQDEAWRYWYKCPTNCTKNEYGHIQRYDKFCSNCGIKLIWEK
jgi:hypothetical protein